MDLQHQQKFTVFCSWFSFVTYFTDTESLHADDSSDDEPLSELAKKLEKKKTSGKAAAVMKSRRSAANKTGKC